MDFQSGFTKQVAVVGGGSIRTEGKRFHSHSTIQFRFYGKTFNSHHFSYKLLYREQPASLPLYANTVGDYLYPLRKFDTPFSQWAVFTEYQGANVGAATVFGHVGYTIVPRMQLRCDYDLNLISAGRDTAYNHTSGNSFLYPFLTFGLFYTPSKNISIGLIATNKGMNLDLSYPTFYLYKNPYLGIRMTLGFDGYFDK